MINDDAQGLPVRSQTIVAARTAWSSAALLRPSEWVLLLYFSYAAVLAVHFDVTPARRAMAISIPVLLMGLRYMDLSGDKPWTTYVRDWIPAPLLLVAYWELDWYRAGYQMQELEQKWVAWDRILLYHWGLRAAIESLGAVIPSLLEISYTLLYTIPPLSIAALYLYRRQDRVDRFLFPFLLGTFTAYALLPFFPTDSPRIEFPGQDLPTILTLWRRLNLWILTHGDIHTSVFPSGHVTTAFSAAFAMMLALPERKWVGQALFFMAVIITIATIYGRYHYAADGIAGLALSLAACAVTVVARRD